MNRPAYSIRLDDLHGPEIGGLLREHLAFAAEHSPPGSRHALDVDGLRGPGVTFWSAWDGDALAGCAALREIDAGHGEVKSMRTATPYLRRGAASALLDHLLRVARERGYRRISLETGSMDAFAPARALYARFGFTECGPFAQYVVDPNTVFMTLRLDATAD